MELQEKDTWSVVRRDFSLIYQTSSYSNVLFTSWTMKSSRAPLKYVIDHWTCHGTTFGLHQEKDVRVTMELEVPKRHYFRPTLPFVMIQQVLWWERQKRFSCYKMSGDYGKVLYFYLFWFSNKKNYTHTRLAKHFHSYEERRGEGHIWFFST